jgi:adenine-specific DNA-methyltransferase
MKKTKLELTWIGKDETPNLEPRILIEEPEKSYVGKKPGLTDNRVIFGDNLLALKALEQDLAGKVKCIFIDPPYNTGSAFEHYDDGIEHSLWLTMMRDRLELLHDLLMPDGSIWVSIDDNEVHYLKVIMDECFGRSNFLGNVVWQSKDTPGNNTRGLAQTHNHILAYQRTDAFQPNLLARGDRQLANYSNPDNDPRGPWLGTPLTRAEVRPRDVYPLTNFAGRQVMPPRGSSWRRPPDKLRDLEQDSRVYWGKQGDGDFPMEKKFLSEMKEGMANQTWWPYEFAGSTRNASAEMKGLFEGTKAFETPKPERLGFRILGLATNPGDLVLDSFAGSGTTGAVAHKMGRRFVLVELGEHCHTHILPRLRKVVDGDDPGGITEAVSWKGGGGFRYYRLGPSLLEKDDWGNWIISEKYNGPMLAEALCKLEGFRFDPDPSTYFIHGRSSERDFLYETTQTLTYPQLERLSKDVGKKRSLLVMCGAFKATPAQLDGLANLTVRKIPQSVLTRCEFGKDDYSLKLPEREETEDTEETDAVPENGPGQAAPTPKKRTKPKVPVQSLPLFDRNAEKKGGRS